MARDWLSDEELFRLTRKRRGAARSRALAALGIPHKRRIDGSVVVFRRDLRAGQAEDNVLAGSAPPGRSTAPASNGLNWN